MADKEQKVNDSKPTRKVPPPDATPSEVRAYLVHVLIHDHEATPESAREMADHWKFGRGSDLRHFKDYQSHRIFKGDVGTYLHRSIQRDLWEEWWASYALRHVYAAIAGGSMAATIIYFYDRAVYTLFVLLVLPQAVLATKLPEDGFTPVPFVTLFLTFGVFMAAVFEYLL